MIEANKEIKQMYIKILRNMLQHPEKWETDGSGKITSPDINSETDTHFETKYVFDNAVYIRKGDYTTVYELKFDFFDFETSYLIKKLRKYHREIHEKKQTDELNNNLMESLGKSSNRFLKILKIKNKI